MSGSMTSTKVESVEKIAKDLVAKCRKEKYDDVVQAYYSPNAVSVEAQAQDGKPREIRGIQAIMEKNKRWVENSEVHKVEVSDPLVAGSYFTVKFTLDATCKQTKQRMKMEEIALYQVENGKIIREEFIYDCDGAGDSSTSHRNDRNKSSTKGENGSMGSDYASSQASKLNSDRDSGAASVNSRESDALGTINSREPNSRSNITDLSSRNR